LKRIEVMVDGSAASHDPAGEGFDASRYWRGPVWLIVNYMIADGLRRAGQTDVAEKIKHDSLELIEKGGFAEYYDPLSGAACGGGGIHVDRGHGYQVCQPIGDRMKRSQVNDIMVQADDMIRIWLHSAAFCLLVA
jgi:hypothetical protein